MARRRRQVHVRYRGHDNARARKLALAIKGNTPGVYFTRAALVDELNKVGRGLPDYEAMAYRTTLPKIREKLDRISRAFRGAVEDGSIKVVPPEMP